MCVSVCTRVFACLHVLMYGFSERDGKQIMLIMSEKEMLLTLTPPFFSKTFQIIPFWPPILYFILDTNLNIFLFAACQYSCKPNLTSHTSDSF